MIRVHQLALRTLALCCIAALGAACLPAHAQVDEQHVIVSYKHGKAAKFRALGDGRSRHARIKHDLPRINALAMVVSAAELRLLRRDRDVDFIEEDVKRYPLALTRESTGAPYLAGQLVPYGIKMVQADQLPDTNTANRKLCIIDSGYDRSHEDLPSGAHITGEYDAAAGWWYTDERKHGTHVAGTILALNNSGTGVVGVAPNNRLKVHIVKVFDADGWAYSSTLSAAAEQCAAAGAHVINMSIGGARYSKTEEATFAALAARGILSVSAAGNGGNRNLSYPAAYDSVLMVGAVNEFMQHSSYSQYNSKVELVAPGDQVYSTVPMGDGVAAALTMPGETLLPGTLEGSPQLAVSGPVADFGLGDKVTDTMAGKVCLIARGSISFAEKVLNCQKSGGIGAVVYNNVFGIYNGTLGNTVTAIPSATVSDYDGSRLKANLGSAAALTVKQLNYKYIDGTSMAVPHVAGVAALVWSYFPACSGNQIRSALSASARDISSGQGRNDRTGNGLVQARAAYDYLAQKGCSGPT